MLTPQHYAILKARAIDDRLIAARGIRSVEASEAEMFGFTKVQRRRGLLIPLWGMDGELKGYQLRADNPRLSKKGKVVKYDTPFKQRNVLDINPLLQPEVRKGRAGLWITEGSLKGDALGSFGFPAISIAGVWGWLGTNSEGASTTLADWEDVSIRGSRFMIAFDSDISTDEMVAYAAKRLKRWLLYKKADQVSVLVLPHTGTEKTGVDDYLASMLKGEENVLQRTGGGRS